MPKKKSAKDQARYYTAVQRVRPRPQEESEEPIKDVTTQLQELRIKQERERQLSKPKTPDPLSISVTRLPVFLPIDPSASCTTEPPARPARRIPGPPPPPSWLRRPAHRRLGRTSITEIARAKTEPVPTFPDLERTSLRSLLHHALYALGTYYFDHQEVNKYYLPQLGIQLKQWLLSYIAAKNITGGITKTGLDVLFPRNTTEDDPEEMIEIIALSRKDEADLRYLDLSDLLTTVSLSQLRTFLCPPRAMSLNSSDEWENILPRFPNLTHLSLDISPVHKPQFDQMKLAHILTDHCTRLTHISLAGLFPSVTSAAALVYLSKHLVCLEYIDLSRTPMLHEEYGADYMSSWDTFSGGGIRVLDRLDWGGGCRNVRTLVVRKCGFTKEREDESRQCILNKRGGMPWIRIITR